MREIKFRAWDGCDMRFLDMKKHGIYVCGSHKDLMQHTGLKDRKGRDIYEGDILNDKRLGTGKVYFNKGIGAFAWDCGTDWGVIEYWDCEVIGNIHENPELLEGR